MSNYETLEMNTGSTKHSSCGCSGGNCGCQSSSQTSYKQSSSKNSQCGCADGPLVQPHFFAGQLLTDDDLQALTQYMLTKQRLHNRFLVGQGVACGLAVSCHPCEKGFVKVGSGYAVDCCGNEILVPCPTELDINAMVRELKYQKHGYECKDPCSDKTDNSRYNEEDCRDDGDRYCLYLQYCENLSDPIATYHQEDGCADACQPSRIKEGYRFELRCEAATKTPPSIVDKIRCCLGNIKESDFRASEFERSQQLMINAQPAMLASAGNTRVFSQNDVQLLSQPSNLMFHHVIETDDNNELSITKLDEYQTRETLDTVQKYGSAIARWQVLDDREKAQYSKNNSQLSSQLESNRSMLRNVSAQLEPKIKDVLSSPVEKSAAITLVQNTLTYTNPEAQIEEYEPFSAKLYTANVSLGNQVYGATSEALSNFKQWLLRKINECPPTSDCCLAEQLAAITIPQTINNDNQFNEQMITATESLARIFLRYLVDCICSALLPPCPECDDDAVLLACLKVKNCKVTDICNLERTFLLTENNLRYWMPFLRGFGEALEKICCELPSRLKKKVLTREVSRDEAQSIRPEHHAETDIDGNPISYELQASRYQPELATPYFQSGESFAKDFSDETFYPNILRIAGLEHEDVQASLGLGENVASLASRDTVLRSLMANNQRVESSTSVAGQALNRLLDSPQTKDLVQNVARTHLSQFEERVNTASATNIKLAEEMQERFNARLHDIEGDLSKRLTTSKLTSSKVVKDLQASLDKQNKLNDTLVARLEKLEKEKKGDK